MLEGEGTEESRGLMSLSESSDEEPNLFCLKSRTAGWRKKKGDRSRQRVKGSKWKEVIQKMQLLTEKNLEFYYLKRINRHAMII